jgi:hypothetical protein
LEEDAVAAFEREYLFSQPSTLLPELYHPRPLFNCGS